jgi:DNA-directed RNA polymerase subunit RPC12/RpoP
MTHTNHCIDCGQPIPSPDLTGRYSCDTCHHARALLKVCVHSGKKPDQLDRLDLGTEPLLVLARLRQFYSNYMHGE